MLALLAIAFPGLAQAEEATGPVYEPDIPTVPHEESSKPPKKNNGSNDGGTEDSEAGKSNAPTGQGSGGNGPNSGGGANNGQTSQGPQGGGGKAGDGAEPAKNGVGGGKPLQVQPASSTSDDGSSSPLVPILIAIAVLAAISIGAFLYRQRRQDPGSPVSPKAS